MERRERFRPHPGIVDKRPRHDAFEAEGHGKLQGGHTVLLLLVGGKPLYIEERTEIHQAPNYHFWVFSFFFFFSLKDHFHPSLQKGKPRK